MSDRDDETRWGYPGQNPDPGQDGRARDGYDGSHHGGHQDWVRESSALPADLAAVQADDALLDALGGPTPRYSPSDEALASVLLQWRREVDSEPVAELVDTDTAMELVAGARRPAPRRNPVLMPFAAAAALLVIAFSGVGLAAKSAEPGDRLWGVTQVLYSDHARSVEAADTVQRELREAETALDQGRAADAQTALDRAEQDLGVVSEEDGQDQLAQRHDVLESQLAEQPAEQDEPSGPPAGSSSSQPPSDAAGPPPASSEPDDRTGTDQSTSPSTSPSESQPDSETPPPAAEPPSGDGSNSSAQTYSTTPDGGSPSGRSAPETGSTDGTGTGTGTSLGSGAEAPAPSEPEPAPTT